MLTQIETFSQTYFCDDGEVLHSVPVWFVDVSQSLRQTLGRLMHGCGREPDITGQKKYIKSESSGLLRKPILRLWSVRFFLRWGCFTHTEKVRTTRAFPG